MEFRPKRRGLIGFRRMGNCFNFEVDEPPEENIVSENIMTINKISIYIYNKLITVSLV